MLLPRNLGHLQYKPKENVENARFFFFLPPSAAAWASGLSPIRTNGLEEKEKKRLKFLKGKKRRKRDLQETFFPPTFPYAYEKEGGGEKNFPIAFGISKKVVYVERK